MGILLFYYYYFYFYFIFLFIYLFFFFGGGGEGGGGGRGSRGVWKRDIISLQKVLKLNMFKCNSNHNNNKLKRYAM